MKSKTPSHQVENRILSALPNEERGQLLPKLEAAPLTSGDVLCDIGARIEYVYFPNNGLTSVISYTLEGETLEVFMAGYEGMVGLSAFLGDDISPHRVIVQSEGSALKMKATAFKAECDRLNSLQSLMLRYTQSTIIQISQTALCNRFHAIEFRLCRWLLLWQDLVRSNTLILTQEFLSYMLGCRRAGVTVAAGKLQSKGLISYSRGQVIILDRARLELLACECYGVITGALCWLNLD